MNDFRQVVGEQILRYKHEYMTTTGHAVHRDQRWPDWLLEVEFDEGTKKIVEKIDDNTVSGLKDKQSNIELYIAIYYRFHAILDDMSFADAIDCLLWDMPLREEGKPVFVRDVKSTEPFSHPPNIRAVPSRKVHLGPVTIVVGNDDDLNR